MARRVARYPPNRGQVQLPRGAVNTLFALVRALHVASLMTVFGACALLWQARKITVMGRRLRNVINASAITALVTACLWVVFVAREMGGVDVPGLSLFASVATESYYGKVTLCRFLLLLALCDL